MKRIALAIVIAALLAGSLSGWALAKEKDPGARFEAVQSQEQVQEEAVPGTLGIVVSPITRQLAWWLDLEKAAGVIVLKVVEDGPAAAAGVQAKDIITAVAVGDSTVSRAGQIVAALKRVKAGDDVVLTILRDGSEQEITVVAVERPQPETPLARLFPELKGIAPGQLFEHYLGGQLSFTDAEGNVHTFTITPGIVQEVGEGYITIIPNGQTEPVTFTTTEETVIVPRELKAEMRVSVIVVDDAEVARAILNPAAMGLLKNLRQQIIERQHQGLPKVKERLQQMAPQLKKQLKQNMPRLWQKGGNGGSNVPSVPQTIGTAA